MNNSPQSQPDRNRADYQEKWLDDGIYWSYDGIEWHKHDPQPHKSQSQDELEPATELDVILDKYAKWIVQTTNNTIRGDYTDIPKPDNQTLREQLLAWRRTTSLEALPEERSEEYDLSMAQRTENFGFNQAIDLTKKNIGDL